MATLLDLQQKFIVLFFPSGGKVQMPLRLRLQPESPSLNGWKIAHTFKGNSLRPGLRRRTASAAPAASAVWANEGGIMVDKQARIVKLPSAVSED
jgi:hypothetical protein